MCVEQNQIYGGLCTEDRCSYMPLCHGLLGAQVCSGVNKRRFLSEGLERDL